VLAARPAGLFTASIANVIGAMSFNTVTMISDDQNESALVLIQSVSEDPSPKYNYNHFYSSAGNRNRKVYSAEELNLFHKAVVAINSQVAISCKTQNFSPIFYN
jgi:hypothetical protein